MDNAAKIKAGLVMLTIVIALTLVGSAIYRASEEDGVIITVKKTERVNKAKDSYYLCWTEEGEVFTVSDSLAYLTWNSSDRYGQLEVGKKYKCKVAGWRIHFLSWYRNLIRIEVAEQTGALLQQGRALQKELALLRASLSSPTLGVRLQLPARQADVVLRRSRLPEEVII